ncbi:MAG: DUF2726 domain-containing protein [Armatimonadota bacterium]
MTDTHENAGCLGALLRLFLPQDTKGKVTYPYKVRDDFLSAAELSLYHVLMQVVGTSAVVLTKVRLADLFFVQRPNENRAAFNRIAQRHVDYLLCHPQTMQPLLGVELDDASHARKDRAERDDFVDNAFAAAGLPLLRVPAQRAYNTRELAEKINRYLTVPVTAHPMAPPDPPPPPPTLDNHAPGAPPTCPKCGETMVLRTGTKGTHAGESFYGCPNYPRCRSMLPTNTR